MVHSFPPLHGRRARNRAVHRLVTLSGLALMLVVAGCASVPPPDGAMSQAQTQLQAARAAGAADYAPIDLDFAQNRFQQAQAAFADHKYEDAANLADEASADADLARAKAQLGAARAQIQSKTETNHQLQQQMDETHPLGDSASGPGSSPASSDSSAPVGDMPAPSASVLSAPMTSGQGFQTVPQSNAPTTSNDGGHL